MKFSFTTEDIDTRFNWRVAATIIFQTRKLKLIHQQTRTTVFPNRVHIASWVGVIMEWCETYIWFDLLFLFNGISIFVGYLMPDPSLLNNSDII